MQMKKLETPDAPANGNTGGKQHWSERVRHDLAEALEAQKRLQAALDATRQDLVDSRQWLDAERVTADRLREELAVAREDAATLRAELARRDTPQATPAAPDPLTHPVLFAATSWYAARRALGLVSEIVRDDDEMLVLLQRAAGDAEDRLLEATAQFVAKRKDV